MQKIPVKELDSKRPCGVTLFWHCGCYITSASDLILSRISRDPRESHTPITQSRLAGRGARKKLLPSCPRGEQHLELVLGFVMGVSGWGFWWD